VTAEQETDFSQMTDAQVLAVAQSAKEEGLARRGRACADLNARGWTWEQIGAAMGVNLSTAYRWARPYLPR
jgi:hypothetical protein